jgi:hypothetical protein
MNVLNDTQRRVLTFIQAANHGGQSPTPEEVIEWVERPDLKPGKVTKRRVQMPAGPGVNLAASQIAQWINRDMAKSIESIRKQMNDIVTPAVMQIASSANLWSDERVIEEREPDETVVEQVRRFRWVKTSATGAGLVLTDLGRALLRADADQATAADITMLGGDDPLAWGNLVGLIAEVGSCLIVDPYLKPEQFLDVAKFTGTTRVILKRPQRQYETVAWQIYQALPEINIDIRIAESQFLHDRYIVGETAVYTLGCSLSGVGVKPTTLVPMTGEVADKVRATVEGWWAAAEPIGGPPAAEAEPEQDEEETGPEAAGGNCSDGEADGGVEEQ